VPPAFAKVINSPTTALFAPSRKVAVTGTGRPWTPTNPSGVSVRVRVCTVTVAEASGAPRSVPSPGETTATIWSPMAVRDAGSSFGSASPPTGLPLIVHATDVLWSASPSASAKV